MAPDVSGRYSPCFEVFPVENFVNLRPACQKELRRSMKHTRDVFDTRGSGKFKVPSFSLGNFGRNAKIQQGDWKPMTVTFEGFVFLVNYDILSGI